MSEEEIEALALQMWQEDLKNSLPDMPLEILGDLSFFGKSGIVQMYYLEKAKLRSDETNGA
jgi:hypothetical protein